MDDTAQKQPVDQVAPQAPPVVTPINPVSTSASREQEPAKTFPDVSKMSESDITKEEKELEKQIEAMAEKSPKDQKPYLDEEIKRVGVALSEEGTNEPAISVGDQPLTMTFNQAKTTRKKYNWRNSISWLATLIMYHWKKIRAREK